MGLKGLIQTLTNGLFDVVALLRITDMFPVRPGNHKDIFHPLTQSGNASRGDFQAQFQKYQGSDVSQQNPADLTPSPSALLCDHPAWTVRLTLAGIFSSLSCRDTRWEALLVEGSGFASVVFTALRCPRARPAQIPLCRLHLTR